MSKASGVDKRKANAINTIISNIISQFPDEQRPVVINILYKIISREHKELLQYVKLTPTPQKTELNREYEQFLHNLIKLMLDSMKGEQQ